ncbi:acyltransferase domain-containing protein [Streptomyces sp. H34-S4]|nr:acyltransferase domain-containing protein [Streptomyces sp. H34-S4]
MPDPLRLPQALLDLAVPHEDINELVRLQAVLTADPDLRALLDRALSALLWKAGEPEHNNGLPDLPPEASGSMGAAFAVFVYLAALPYTRAHHRARGIPSEISRRSLEDLGRQLAVHRRRFGSTGLHTPDWLTRHFRGELYQLARLQFERVRLDHHTAEALAGAGAPARTGQAALSLHIPDFHGPLTPEACEESLALARDFFAGFFPEEPTGVVLCESWLLDPQLRHGLPGHANIVAFQNRFTLTGDRGRPERDSAVSFVFGASEADRRTLPRETSMQRAVLDHLDEGGHWYTRLGWFALDSG